MDKEGDTDVHLKPLDGEKITVTLQHQEPTIPLTQYRIPFRKEKTEVRVENSPNKYMWKGDTRLEQVGGNNSRPIATFHHEKEKNTLKCGILRIRSGESISVELVVITALAVQARADKFGK